MADLDRLPSSLRPGGTWWVASRLECPALTGQGDQPPENLAGLPHKLMPEVELRKVSLT